MRLLRALVPKMDQGGAILFITSTSVRQPIPNLDTSNVLRPGVAALAKTLARELAPDIRVNSLAPGRFDTDRIRALDAGRAEATGMSQEEVAAESSKEIPFGRYGEPIEFGRFARLPPLPRRLLHLRAGGPRRRRDGHGVAVIEEIRP